MPEYPGQPEQRGGVQTNTESCRELASQAEAADFYRQVRGRLLRIAEWHRYAGTGSAEFVLTDGQGSPVSRAPQLNDYLRIDIPGPGTVSGEGYDWVQIEAVEESEETERSFTLIRVRPAPSPVNSRTDVAHFFSGEATSDFMVKREGQTVTAGVYGRNEKPNTAADTLADKARNTAVATGAISGFSKLQWKSLAEGLLKG